MKKKLVVVCVAAILAIPMIANAVLLVQSDSVVGGWLDFNRGWAFNQFDDEGGLKQLVSVKMTINTQVTAGYFIADNDADLPTNIKIDYNILTSLTSPDVTIAPLNLNISGSEDVALAANIGDLPGFIDGTSPDGVFLSPDPAMHSTSIFMISGIDDLSQFIGTGTINTLFTSARTFNITGAGGVEGAYSVMVADAGVEIIYDYFIVPEPATLAILGLGGLLIRRKKK